MATKTNIPVLYSFRRCPYAIRARMALYYSGLVCELREVLLKSKPESMLANSPKATVPVLMVDDKVIDESIAVMDWALRQSDPHGWKRADLVHSLVIQNDTDFKRGLDHYKYFDRYPENTQEEYFLRTHGFLQQLENSMVTDEEGKFWLLSAGLSAIDVAIFPFIRQFALVDPVAFERLPMPALQSWLSVLLASEEFNAVMHKYPAWLAGQAPVYLGKAIV